jgi:PEP-CTERM motif
MKSPKALLIAAGLACLSLSAAANSVDYANSRATVTAINGGTAVTLTGSILTTVTGGVCSSICTGKLGTAAFTSGALASGSLAAGGTFGAGGSFTITGNGKKGIPSDSEAWASGDTTTGSVPEPGSLAFMGTGALGIGAVLRRKLFA